MALMGQLLFEDTDLKHLSTFSLLIGLRKSSMQSWAIGGCWMRGGYDRTGEDPGECDEKRKDIREPVKNVLAEFVR